MLDWNSLLSQKYRILQQNADTQQQNADAGTLAAKAGANLDYIKAGLMPAESRAQIALQGAQGLMYGANARNTDEETKYVGLLANANADSLRSGAYANRQQGGLYGQQARTAGILNSTTLGMTEDQRRAVAMGRIGLSSTGAPLGTSLGVMPTGNDLRLPTRENQSRPINYIENPYGR